MLSIKSDNLNQSRLHSQRFMKLARAAYARILIIPHSVSVGHRATIARNSVFECHLSPVRRLMASKTEFLNIFDLRSSIVSTVLIATYAV